MSDGFAARWPVRQEHPATSAAIHLGDEIRDELIAIEGAARHLG